MQTTNLKDDASLSRDAAVVRSPITLPVVSTTSGKCWIRFEALTSEQLTSIADQFAEHNASGWSVSTQFGINRFTGHVERPNRSRRALPVGERVSLSNEVVLDRILSFAKYNATFFGVDAEYLAALDWSAYAVEPDKSLIGWRVNGREPTSNDAGSTWPDLWWGQFHYDGVQISFYAPVRDPDFDICRDADLMPEDVLEVSEVIGYELHYSTFTGIVSAGQVQAQNVEAIQLDVLRSLTDEYLEFRLTYRVRVKMGALGWSFFVDAQSGELLQVRQEFAI